MIAMLASGCTETSLRYTFRDPSQVSPPRSEPTLVVYPGSKTPRHPDGSAQMSLELAHHEAFSTGLAPQPRRDGMGNLIINDFGQPIYDEGVYVETSSTTLVTSWDNVTIEQIKTPNRYLGVIAVVTAVCISPFLMLDSVDANGPVGYTVLGLTAGGLGLMLWPRSTTTLWAPQR